MVQFMSPTLVLGSVFMLAYCGLVYFPLSIKPFRSNNCHQLWNLNWAVWYLCPHKCSVSEWNNGAVLQWGPYIHSLTILYELRAKLPLSPHGQYSATMLALLASLSSFTDLHIDLSCLLFSFCLLFSKYCFWSNMAPTASMAWRVSAPYEQGPT